MASVLALSGTLIGAIVAFSVIGLLVMAIYAFSKMRKDEFWDEEA